MPDILSFSKIKNDSIFENEYYELNTTGNNSIEFKNNPHASGGIAVLYAPNGTGKTSLSELLSLDTTTENKLFIATYNGVEIKPEDRKFHIIKDQLKRNIIPGDTSDYLVGADIRREYELRKRISNGFLAAYADISKKMKDNFLVTKIKDYLLFNLQNETAKQFLSKIVPNRTRGRNIEKGQFIQFIIDTEIPDNPADVDEDRIKFLIEDCAKSQLAKKILSFNFDEIITNIEIRDIEKSDDAIRIINKYPDLSTCIVCDHENYNSEVLLAQKEEKRKRIYESLDQETREIFDGIVNASSLKLFDPFEIKSHIMSLLAEGDTEPVMRLQEEFRTYLHYISNRMIKTLLTCFDETSMLDDYREFSDLIENQPIIDDEDLLFIKDVISENIGPEITFVRDDENERNFKLMLAGQDFIGVDRDKLHLSAGEQNFISLAFELLLARNSSKEFIVVDDPVSSFDSVYKNKIAFCLVKFLENKKQIILTHNTDLIRLLEVQKNGCFNMYILNNVEGGNNGFIKVSGFEKNLLINLSKLVKFFQNKDNALIPNIVDERNFLISMIPFMRGYAHIAKNGDSIYTRLSSVMHGYETGSVNITTIYEELFGYRFANEHIISVTDIVNFDCNNISVLNSTEYPLLAETLRQTLIYYHLRMKVEYKLVEHFGIEIDHNDPPTLNQLIHRAFRCTPDAADAGLRREYRVFFTSRKTLINEFNHFEGNMNIFQPAIDIEANALDKEVTQVENKLLEMSNVFV